MQIKSNKAITIISLVITLIVLAIIAGITVTSAIKNKGTIIEAKEAKSETEYAEIKQDVVSAYVQAQAGKRKRNEDLSERIEDNLRKKYGNDASVTLENEKYLVIVKDKEYTIDNEGTIALKSGLTLSKNSIILKVNTQSGSSETLEATLDEGVTGNITWRSSDTSIVLVEGSGTSARVSLVEGATSGTATITAKIEGTQHIDKCKVSIYKNYVGYYADIDGNGVIEVDKDGIIFADLAYGTSGTGLTAVTNGLKNYEESTTNYAGIFGTQKFVKLANGTKGTDRFYVMALQDIDADYHYWYKNAYNYSEKTFITSNGIGIDPDTGKFIGKKNTDAIMAVFNKEPPTGWGLKATGQSFTDVFDVISDKCNAGWFLPSKQEWEAFSGATINGQNVLSNYASFGLSLYYWSSSLNQVSLDYAYNMNFYGGSSGSREINDNYYVRLCTTF